MFNIGDKVKSRPGYHLEFVGIIENIDDDILLIRAQIGILIKIKASEVIKYE